MKGMSINPYAIYVFCDGAMDYNSKNTGGIGICVKFPESVELSEITRPIGRYEGANIERLELEAINQGMDMLMEIFEKEGEKLKPINRIIFITDRYGLNDSEKTNVYRIKEWRHNKWKNFENKPIKNSDLLDKLDKKRKKLSKFAHSSIEIKYERRKFNKPANKAAKEGKKQAIADKSIELLGVKIGKRQYSGHDIDYKIITKDQKFIVRIYKKEPIGDEWEISAEICEGKYFESKILVYVESAIESSLHRHHKYQITISDVYRYHVRIYRDVIEKT